MAPIMESSWFCGVFHTSASPSVHRIMEVVRVCNWETIAFENMTLIILISTQVRVIEGDSGPCLLLLPAVSSSSSSFSTGFAFFFSLICFVIRVSDRKLFLF